MRMKDLMQVGRFGIVGASNTLLSFCVYAALVRFLHPHESGASIAQFAGYGAGTIWSFVWNRRFTFRSLGPRTVEVRRFFLVHTALAITSTLGIALCLKCFSFSPVAAWLIVMPGIIITNFTLQRNWAFNTQGNQGPREFHDGSFGERKQ